MKSNTIIESDFESINTIRSFSFSSDEPIEKGGQNSGPTPMEYLCASLGSCTTITLKMYINRKEWKVDSIHVEVELMKDEKEEIYFNKTVTIVGDVSEENIKRIKHISSACPVNKLLAKSTEIKTNIIIKNEL